MKYENKIKKTFFFLSIFSIIFWATPAKAGDIFSLRGYVPYRSGGSLLTGDANSPNSKAVVTGYRLNINNNFSRSDTPDIDQIYPADGAGIAAYFNWDVGSSSWSPSITVGDTAVTVAETYSGLNGWSEVSWVGASGQRQITQDDIWNSGLHYGLSAIVMEPIPTPSITSATVAAVDLQWTGLWNNDTGAAGGTAHNTITGYGVYRSDNSGAYQKLAALATQNAGGAVTYADTTVQSGHSYTYKLSVLFTWTVHTPNYFESSAQGPSSAVANASSDPTRLVFSSPQRTIAAGNKSAVITVETRDVAGNVQAVKADTTVALSSDSSGVNKKFYSVSGGVCTSTEITEFVVATGNSSVQFCYYDEKISSPTWMMTAHQTAPVSPALTDGTQVVAVGPGVFGSLNLTLAATQQNRKTFTGTNTLTAYDAFGNVKTDFQAATNNVTFTVAPANGAVSGLSGVNKLNLDADFSNGVANLTAKLIFSGIIGNYNFTATSADAKTTTSGVVNISAGDYASFDFSLTSPQVMDAAFSGVDTLTVKDADGNVVTDFDASVHNVTITESVAAGIVSGLGSGNNNVLNQVGNFTNGVCDLSGKLKYGGLSGSRQFRAVSGSANSLSDAVSFGPGVFAKFGMSINSPQINDTYFVTANVTAQDVYGNVVIDYDASTVGQGVLFSVSGSGIMTVQDSGTPVLDLSSDFVGGTANLAGKLKYTGLIGTYTLTATSDNGKVGNASTTIQAGATNSVRINNALGAGGAEISNVTINVDAPLNLWMAGYDVSGNFVNNATTGHWTVTGFDSGDSFAQIDVNNASTISFSPHMTPQSGVIHFDAGSGMTDVTGTITVEAGSARTFDVSAPATATTGVGFSNTQITAKDQYGNVALGYDGSKTLILTGPASGPESGAPTSSVTAIFTSGVASSIAPIVLVRAETVKITLTQGSISGQSGNVVVSAGTATHLHLVSPATVTAGVSFSLTSITAQDQYGNVATGYSGDKTIVYSGPSASALGDSPSYTTAVEFVNGVSTTALMTELFRTETATIHITEGAISGDSNDIAVQAGAAGSIEYYSGNNQIGIVNSNLANPLVVLVKDVYGNPKSGQAVTFAVTIGDGSMAPGSAVTDVDGRAQTVWRLGSMSGAGLNQGEARVAGLFGTPIVFYADGVPSVPTLLDVTAPSEVIAGVPFAITIKAIDAFGNVVTAYNGTKVVSYSGPHASPSGTAPVYSSSVDFSDGQNNAVSTTLYKAETVTLTVSSGGLSGDSLSIVVKPADTNQFNIMAPATAIVNLPFIIASLRALDLYGNVATDYSGSKTISYSGPDDSDSGTHPVYTAGVTFVGGVASTQLDTTLVKAEITQIIATDSTISGTSNNIVVSYAESFVLTYVSGNNQTGSPSTTLPQPLVAKVIDSSGNPASGKTVMFTPASGSGSVSPVSVIVGETGLASVSWTLGSSDSLETVTASVPGLASTVLYVTNAGGGGFTGTRLVFTTLTQEVAKNIASGTITVCLQNVEGNNVSADSNKAISLAANSATGKFATNFAGPWDKTSITISSGSSCANLYYQDSASGLMTITASSTEALSGLQSIYIKPDVVSASPAATSNSSSTVTENNTTNEGDHNITNKNVANNNYTIIINNFYYASPQSKQVDVNNQAATITVSGSSVPTILSPRDGSLVMDTDAGVTVSGTAMPHRTVVVSRRDGQEIGSTTSDKQGNWKMMIFGEKLGSSDNFLSAKVVGEDEKSAPVNFQVKDGSDLLKKLLRLFSSK
ncbi:MAG: hypothetical protein WAV73_05670 [Candidatus Moraniibacteriota bacterium]